jgi:photosystem II stability/assembly factor-like uncharacterized protein
MTSKRMLCALAAGAAIAATAPAVAGAEVQVGSSGWTWGNPQPQGNTIRSMAFAGLTGYAAGDFGTLLKTTDGGASWSGLSVGSFQNFRTVQAVSPTTIIAGGGCVARRSDNGGASFTRIDFASSEIGCKTTEQLIGVSFIDANTGWLLLGDGTVTQTANGGGSFSQKTALPGTGAAGGQAQPTDIAFINATTGFGISSEGKIFQTTDGGESWKVVSDTKRKVSDITFVTPTNGFAVGDGGLFLRTTDGGTTWTPKDLGAGAQNLTSVRCADIKLCIIATAKGDQLVRTPDAGDTASLLTPATDPIYAAAFASPTQLAAAGANGSSVVSADGGANFTKVGGRLTGKYFGIRAGGQQGTAYAPGDNGSLAVTTDGGKNWVKGNVATSEDVSDVSFPTATTGYALDVSNTVRKTTDGGKSWTKVNIGPPATVNAIYSSNADTVLAILSRGVRRIAGGTPKEITDGDVAKKSLVGVDRAGSAVVAWGSQDVVVSSDGGQTWKPILKPGKYKKVGRKRVNRRAVDQVDFTSAKQGFLRDSKGIVWRTSNGGKKWTQLFGVGTEDAAGMAFSSATAGYLVIPSFGRTSNAGFLLRTTNGGATWHPQFVVNTPIKPFGIAAAGGGTDYLLGGDTALLSSTTGGDRGGTAAISLKKPKKVPTKAAKLAIEGTLSKGGSNQAVTISYLRPGSGFWQHQTVDTAEDGSFSANFNVRKGVNTFVAQWAGDFENAGAGSKVLTVNVRKKR